MKNVYLSSNNNPFFCLLVLEWKDEAPVEIAFTSEGPVMHICLLLVLFHSLEPTFDKDVTAFLSCQDIGFLKKDILRVPDNHSQLITNNNTNVSPLLEVRNSFFWLDDDLVSSEKFSIKTCLPYWNHMLLLFHNYFYTVTFKFPPGVVKSPEEQQLERTSSLLTSKSNLHATSPHNIHTLFSNQWRKYKTYQLSPDFPPYFSLNYITASRDIWGETTECCPYVVGFLGVMSTGAPGEGMSIGNMSTHISILP